MPSPRRGSSERQDRPTAIAINDAPDQQQQAPNSGGWSNRAQTLAAVAAQTSDAVGAGLSLSTALAPQSATVRNLVSGAAWTASGVIGGVTGRATGAAWAAGAGALNAVAGAASVVSTGFGTVQSPSWEADQASPDAAYVSNAAWIGAGLATIGDGISTVRGARNWSGTFAGYAQFASGAANVVAGAAGVASTYWHGQNPLDPRAATAAVVSGAAWVTGSAFGAIGAGLSWYSRRGSASGAVNEHTALLDP